MKRRCPFSNVNASSLGHSSGWVGGRQRGSAQNNTRSASGLALGGGRREGAPELLQEEVRAGDDARHLVLKAGGSRRQADVRFRGTRERERAGGEGGGAGAGRHLALQDEAEAVAEELVAAGGGWCQRISEDFARGAQRLGACPRLAGGTLKRRGQGQQARGKGCKGSSPGCICRRRRRWPSPRPCRRRCGRTCGGFSTR